MAKPRIFISSTFYDLKQVRADIDQFIKVLGYESIRNEQGNIPYGKENALEDYCYDEISNIDILVAIIGGKFGSESTHDIYSVSQMEIKTALKNDKQTYLFIEKNVSIEYENYLLNKGNKKTSYRFVDNVKIYEFIEEIKNLPSNNTIKEFETSSDIVSFLKEQWSGLFQRFLQEQTRDKEIKLIKGIENTTKTLDQLVNYLSQESKDKDKTIETILMINHPAISELKNLLGIAYNTYFVGLVDMAELIEARGFRDIEDSVDYLKWYKSNGKNKYFLDVSRSLFDNDDKLIPIKKDQWKKNYIVQTVEEEEITDLPF